MKLRAERAFKSVHAAILSFLAMANQKLLVLCSIAVLMGVIPTSAHAAASKEWTVLIS
jgi:hypothetical protein